MTPTWDGADLASGVSRSHKMLRRRMPEPNRFVAGGYHDMHADAYGNGGGRCETVILLLIIIHHSCQVWS